MPHNRAARPAVVLTLTLFLAACSGSAKKQPATAEKPPATADKTVEKVTSKLAENQPQYAWAALPPSYRKDVDGLIKDYATQTDPVLYDNQFNLLKKVTKVLETKKAFILEHPMLKQNESVDLKKAGENWDAIVKIPSIIANSKLSKLEDLKALDVEEFLATTGSQFSEQLQTVSKLAPKDKQTGDDLSKMLHGVKANLVQGTGDTATVEIASPNGKTEKLEMVKVEGHWIPKDLADNWKDHIKKFQVALQNIGGEKSKENKDQLLGQIKMIEGAVDQLQAAQTQEAFNQATSQAFMMVMGMAMGGLGGLGGPDGGGSPFGSQPEK